MIEFKEIEWEGISFPLTITSLVSKTNHYKLPFDGQIQINRNEDYKLVGVFSGVITDRTDLEYREDGKLVELGFIKGEHMSASDENFNYEIKNLHIKNIEVSGMEETEKGVRIFASSKVFLGSVKKISKKKEQDIFSEFHLCSMPQILFGNRTSRFQSAPIRKIREGLDVPLENEEEKIRKGYSSGWDHAILNYKKHKIIIQQVEESYLPYWTDGLLIEYRGIRNGLPTMETRKFICDFISFIIGSRLQIIGETVFTDLYEIVYTESIDPWGNSEKEGSPMNPIPIESNSRDAFQNILNNLLTKFESAYFEFSLSDCLWKLWIGSGQTLGINLPTIASGLESLIDSYLDKKGLLKKYNKKEKQAYENLIKEDLKSLEAKLEYFDFGKFVVNKINYPYNYGIGEKMKIFFDNIGIEFGKKSIENQALKARNKMSHQNLEGIEMDEILKLKKLSDAYISLLYRVILRLIGYEGYYVDYSKAGVRYLKMDQNL